MATEEVRAPADRSTFLAGFSLVVSGSAFSASFLASKASTSISPVRTCACMPCEANAWWWVAANPMVANVGGASPVTTPSSLSASRADTVKTGNSKPQVHNEECPQPPDESELEGDEPKRLAGRRWTGMSL
eukprot:scaffold133171_cov29-Tisochrysis_lutea.AAC.1